MPYAAVGNNGSAVGANGSSIASNSVAKPRANNVPTQRLASSDAVQLSFFQLDDPVLSQIRDEILELDINNLTPVEALNKLNDIKKILKGR